MNHEQGQEPEIAVDGDDRRPSEAVILAVAEAADVDPVVLPSLHGVVDPDALDALFGGRLPGTVSFEYHDYTVTVREGGTVEVRDRVSG